MKKLYLLIILGLLAAGLVLAQTASEKVSQDAQVFLDSQQEKSDANHQFLEANVFESAENRVKLEEYRKRFNDINGRIYILKNQLTVGQKTRSPDLRALSQKRDQLEGYIKQHDQLLSEYRQWVSSLR